MLILEITAGVCLGILGVPALWLLATTIIYWRKERRWWCATVPVVWTASGENKLRLVAGCCNRASLNQITFNINHPTFRGSPIAYWYQLIAWHHSNGAGVYYWKISGLPRQ